jgi:hypothetical protein
MASLRIFRPVAFKNYNLSYENVSKQLALITGSSRGIAIIPTAIEGAGLHTSVAEDAPIKKIISKFSPMGQKNGQQLLGSGGGLA